MLRGLRRMLLALVNWVAERKLRGLKGIDISPRSTVAYSKIVLKEGCALKIGEDCMIEGSLILDRQNGQIEIGNRVFMGGGSQIICIEKVIVEDDVLISWGCTIVDHNAHSVCWKERANDVTNWLRGIKDWGPVVKKPILIKAKAWIGFNVIVMKGVTIGEGAVVGAGSVVVEDVDPYTVVAGNPARILKRLS
jgi:acetyltransferase-like isoleucine patch superfamily enzyme